MRRLRIRSGDDDDAARAYSAFRPRRVLLVLALLVTFGAWACQ
jgi:hypothetical protein